MIPPEALEKARATAAHEKSLGITNIWTTLVGPLLDEITALQAERDAAAPKLPDDLAGLVRLLKALATDHECDDEMDAASTCDQAASTIQSLVARIAELEAGLEDLLSWFPDKPSEPEWRIKAGNYGADAAVSIARSLLNKDRQP